MKVPELLSPAGDFSKLSVAYEYGADAVYLGVPMFSLRKPCEKNICGDRLQKPDGKKLYGAVNMLFFDDDIDLLKKNISEIRKMPFDAFIVSDLGAARVIRDLIPDAELHLSTQSSCLNSHAVMEYAAIGFKRIILGREVSLEGIRKIKDRVKDVEIEVFVHGAMCMAVSGRCILSNALAGRSGNRGDCTQPCRWKYRLAVEEESRPGSYMPVYDDGNFTTILSSKDLCMIDHIQDLIDAGVDSLKIEGRMKSAYYVAIVTRAYRHVIDSFSFDDETERNVRLNEARKYVLELDNVSHREYTTGFYYDEEKYRFSPPKEDYVRKYRFLGIVGKKVSDRTFELEAKYKIESGNEIEFIGPDVFSFPTADFLLFNQDMVEKSQANINSTSFIRINNDSSGKIREGFLSRGKI